MRIGIVCPYDWVAPGGVQIHVRDLAEALIEMGHDVSVLAPTDDEDDIAESYVVFGGKPISVPYNGSVARLNIGFVSTARVRRWIREGDFDVIHVHEPAAPCLSMLACWVADGPVVATWHSSVERSRAMRVAYYALQTVLEKVSARIAVSERARQTLVDHLGGDAVVIPNGVSCKRYVAAAPLAGYPRPGPTILFLGRIDEPRKGLDVLTAAMPEIVEALPTVELLVAGPGDADAVRKDLPAAVEPHVRFLGLVSDADKIAAFHSVDLYVAPNTGGESFGIVLLEAMASGTPVLASDIDAFESVLQEGRCGLTFANGDPADLARKAIGILRDDDQREALAVEGHRRALMFDWSVVARDVLRVYESVTVAGEKVQSDLSGQALGRLGKNL